MGMHTTAPIVTSIGVWRKKTAADGYHYCFFLNDWHIDYKNLAISKQQQRDTVHALGLCKNPCLIVEDVGSYDGANEAIQESARDLYRYYQSLADDPDTLDDTIYKNAAYLTTDLLAYCRKMGIPSANVECRHFCYNDTLSWQEIRDDLKPHLDSLNCDTNMHPLIENYKSACMFLIPRIAPGDSTNLNQIAYHIVNAKVVQQILNHADKKSIFICIGGAHTQSLNSDMLSLGYEHSMHIGDNLSGTNPDYAIIMASALTIRQTFEQQIFPSDPSLLA